MIRSAEGIRISVHVPVSVGSERVLHLLPVPKVRLSVPGTVAARAGARAVWGVAVRCNGSDACFGGAACSLITWCASTLLALCPPCDLLGSC